MAHVKLNLSGHDNQDLADMGFVFPGSLQVDLADPQLADKIRDFLLPFISSGDVVSIALPGLAPLAALVIANIHGISGSFPNIIPLIRGDNGFIPGDAIDLNNVRNNARQLGRDAIKL